MITKTYGNWKLTSALSILAGVVLLGIAILSICFVLPDMYDKTYEQNSNPIVVTFAGIVLVLIPFCMAIGSFRKSIEIIQKKGKRIIVCDD